MTTHQPLENSTYFKDEDLALAVDATEEEVRKALIDMRCKCGVPHEVRKYSIKRRAPKHYWVSVLSCKKCGDAHRLIYCLTDLKWRVPNE